LKHPEAKPTRRTFIRQLSGSIALIPIVAITASRAALADEFVDSESAKAKGLQYRAVTEIDTARCTNCALYTSSSDTEEGGSCPLFQGVLVHADGWCSAWAAKS